MTIDVTVRFLGAAVPVAVNRFYARRVLQRCERGEITLLDAAELLMAAAKRDGAQIEGVAVARPNSRAFSRGDSGAPSDAP